MESTPWSQEIYINLFNITDCAKLSLLLFIIILKVIHLKNICSSINAWTQFGKYLINSSNLKYNVMFDFYSVGCQSETNI